MSGSNEKGRIDDKTYAALVEVFRQSPGNISAASRKSARSRAFCRRAWETGWASRPDLTPIKVLFEQEAMMARARLRDVENKKRVDVGQLRDKATEDAALARSEEAKLVRMSRTQAGAVLNTAMGLQAEGVALAKHVRNLLKADLTPDKDGKISMSSDEAMGWLARIEKYGKQGIQMVETAMRLERLRLGEPEHWLSDNVQADDMTPEEAMAEIELAKEAADRAKMLGLTVVEGGK